MADDVLVELWKKAQRMAKEEYEENYGNWEEADKYEREDFVWAAYEKLKGEKAPKLLTSGYSSVNYADPYPKLCISVGNMNMCVEGYDFELTVTGDIKFKF